MKKVLALAVAAAIAAPMTAMADATLYGKVRQTVESYEVEAGSASTTADADYIRVQDWFSRLGVKGSEDLGNGLKAVYKMEFGIPISNGTTISSRNAYVGLAGGFGTVLVGRHDTPLKMSTGALDVFAATSGHTSNVWVEDFTDRRIDGTIAYVSPSMAGLTLAVALVPWETNAADGISEAWSAAAMYKNSGLYASVAAEQVSSDALGAADDHELFRVGLGYKADSWRVGAAFESEEQGAAERDKFQVGAAFNFGNNAAKVKYFSVEDDHDGFAVGFDHNFSKRTQAYALYIDSSADGNDDDDTTIIGVGLNHSF